MRKKWLILSLRDDKKKLGLVPHRCSEGYTNAHYLILKNMNLYGIFKTKRWGKHLETKGSNFELVVGNYDDTSYDTSSFSEIIFKFFIINCQWLWLKKVEFLFRKNGENVSDRIYSH